MLVALETILEPVIKEEVLLKDANLGTMTDWKETIGHDHETEKKVKLIKSSLKIDTSTLQIMVQMTPG